MNEYRICPKCKATMEKDASFSNCPTCNYSFTEDSDPTYHYFSEVNLEDTLKQIKSEMKHFIQSNEYLKAISSFFEIEEFWIDEDLIELKNLCYEKINQVEIYLQNQLDHAEKLIYNLDFNTATGLLDGVIKAVLDYNSKAKEVSSIVRDQDILLKLKPVENRVQQLRSKIPKLENYCHSIKDLQTVYDEISFERIIKKSNIKIDKETLVDLIERMIEKSEIYGKIKGESLIFIKENIATIPQNAKSINVLRGGDWKLEGEHSVFHFKVKIKNNSAFLLSNIKILLTSIPSGLNVEAQVYNISSLKPGAFESPTFRLRALESCVGDRIEAMVTYTDIQGQQQSLQVTPFEITYVCNLLVPKTVSKADYEKNTILMDDVKNKFACEGSMENVLEFVSGILEKNNFYLLPPSSEIISTDFAKLKGYAQGKYDQEDVALEVVLQKIENTTQLILKAMSDKVEKLYDINKDISSQCFDIKTDTEVIKEYTPLIEEIFKKIGKLDDIEVYLKEHLASNWEKLKATWEEFKNKKIKFRDLLWKLIKIEGKNILKVLVEFI